MKQKQHESPLSETRHEEGLDAKKALATETWTFWYIAGSWGFAGVAVLYWLGVVGFSPLSPIVQLVNSSVSENGALSEILATPIRFFFELACGFSWAVLAYPWQRYVRYRVGVIEAGSKEAYQRQQQERAAREGTPAAAGLLVGVSIAKGGLFTSSETLVETSEGFFRVSGLVNTVKKGDPVFTLYDQLLIGTGSGQTRYTVIS